MEADSDEAFAAPTPDGSEPFTSPLASDEAVAPVAAPAPAGPELDLDRIAGDLADVERSLDRLADGTYWTDEFTGLAIDDVLLAEHPTARHARPPGQAPTS